MNIAFVTSEYVTEHNFDGGLANYLGRITELLNKEGNNIYVITTSNENGIIIYNGINVIRVKLNSKFFLALMKIGRNRLGRIFYIIYQSFKLNRILIQLHKKVKFDIVQYSSYNALALFAPKDIPRVIRISSYQPLWDKAYEKKAGIIDKIIYHLEIAALKKVKNLYCPSNLLANVIENKIKNIVKVIRTPYLFSINEIDINVYNDILLGKKYLLFFGTLGALKGVKEIAEIIYEVLDKHKDIYFVFCGKDVGYKGMKMIDYVWLKAKEYRGRCIYLGSLEKKYLIPVIKNSHAVVLPSRIDNLPNSCIEAMSLGKIVIGTKGASFEELIDDEVNGILCQPSDKTSFTKAINKVLDLDEAKKISMEKKAVQKIKEMLDSHNIIQNLISFYQSIIQHSKL